MSTLLAAAAGLLLTVIVAAAIRRARRQEAELDVALERALRRLLGPRLLLTAEHLTFEGGPYRLPRSRVRAACRRLSDVEAVAAAVGEILSRPLAPLPGPLSLKIHGPRIHLHLVDPWVLELVASEPRLARQPVADLGLVATYRVDGDSRQCLSEEHLAAQSIDTRDLHGIALAVLRQTFDAGRVAEALAGHRQTLESHDGRAAAALLVLPDFVPPGARLAATLETPDRLILEPWTDRFPAAGPSRRLVIDDCGYEIL